MQMFHLAVLNAMSFYLQTYIHHSKQYLSLSIPQFISCCGISISSYLQSIPMSVNICILLSPRLFLHPLKLIFFYHCKQNSDHTIFPSRSFVSNLLIFIPLTYIFNNFINTLLFFVPLFVLYPFFAQCSTQTHQLHSIPFRSDGFVRFQQFIINNISVFEGFWPSFTRTAVSIEITVFEATEPITARCFT